MKFLLPVILLVVTMTLRPVTAVAESDPPRDFLPTTSKRLQHILATSVSANFQNVPLQEAIDRFARQLQLNIVVSVGPGPDGSMPTLTAHFGRIPLREALFQISREMNLKVEWFYFPEDLRTPRAISIHNR
ncbi:MAG TPA: hypothetical protein VGM54_18850 [Chthoniobacter sp.]|jgi:hypothetical protein